MTAVRCRARGGATLGPALQWAVLLAVLGLVLAGCGGGSNNSGGNGGGGRINNVQPISVNLGVQGNYADGVFTSVTICLPGTSNCQTIPDVLVDTGSYGLRLLGSQVTLSLPGESDGSGNSLGECTQFLDSFTWGPVVTADVQMAGEKASAVPLQLLGEAGFPAPPSRCTSSGLTENDTQATLGANGILGIGVFRHDCGEGCTPANVQIPPIYFTCSGSSCTATSVPLEKQVQNPVWLFPQDNNGVLISLPAVPATGASTATGSLIFGIGTQSDNALGSATVLATDNNGSINTKYQGQNYTGTAIDSGSNGIFFLDSSTLNIPLCGGGNSGFYCPSSTVSFTATNQSAAPAPAPVTSKDLSWDIANADDLFQTGFAAFNNLGGPNSGAFDFGLPIFLGRPVFIGINGTSAGSVSGPFYAY